MLTLPAIIGVLMACPLFSETPYKEIANPAITKTIEAQK